MKKLSIFLLALVACAGIAQADIVDGSCGDNLTWSLNTQDSTLTITGSGEMTSHPWSDYKSYIKYVSLPDGLTSIGMYAFSGCTDLTSVTIPNSVTSIGDFAFVNCSSLTSVEFPNSVTSIGFAVFSGCYNLPVIDNLRYVGNYLVEVVDRELSTYNIRENTKWIGSNAFAYCRSLASIEIPSSVTNIEQQAFLDCSSLTSIEIPNSVTSIGNNAFSGCTGLTSMNIPNSVTSIGANAFNNIFQVTYNGTATGSPWGAKCVNGYMDGWLVYNDQTKTNLLGCSPEATGEIEIPNSVVSIGSKAFSNCRGITSVVIPNSVTTIENSAFNYCTINSLTIPHSVISIGDYAFHSCHSLHDNIEIPNSVQSIGNGAFGNCSNIKSVIIGNGVISIGEEAFSSCSSLLSIIVDAENQNFCSDNSGVLFNKAKTTLIQYPSGKQGVYTIPDGVVNLQKYSFEGSDKLSVLMIPSCVTSIGEYAFWCCRALKSITIPQSVTAIGRCAFHQCDNLITITNYSSVPQWVDESDLGSFNKAACKLYVPEDAISSYQANYTWEEFGEITAIADIPILCSGICGENLTWELTMDSLLTIEGTGEMWWSDDAPWSSLTDLIKYVSLPEGLTSIAGGAFRGCSGLTSIEIPNNVTSIGGAAFSRCTSLTSITIPNSITSIEEDMFYGCTGLVSIEIPNSVAHIGYWAFAGCSSLVTITIPPYASGIAGSTFSDCISLTAINVDGGDIYSSIDGVLFSKDLSTLIAYPPGKSGEYVVPDQVTTIGDVAFFSSAITSLIIPNNVTTINIEAFYECSNLESVTIGSGVTSIGYYAFGFCENLHNLYCYAATPPIVDRYIFVTPTMWIEKQECTLYVPALSVDQYRTADVWKDFGNIVGVEVPEPEPETEEVNCNILYLDKNSTMISGEQLTFHVPEAPEIEGFTFVCWDVVAGHLSEGIIIQAVYTANVPTSAPSEYTNPANPAQKLIKNGNVYILTDDKTYTITGQQVK